MGDNAQYFPKEELDLKPVVEGIESWGVALERIKLTYFEMEPYREFLLGGQENELISMVLEGELFLKIGAQEVAVQRGEVFTVPSNIEYRVRTGEQAVKAVDAWALTVEIKEDEDAQEEDAQEEDEKEAQE